MREMKDSGIGWVHQIPLNWNVIRGKYVFINEKQIVGAKVEEYERLALTMNGVIKRSKEDNEGLQPDKFDTYQILRNDELVFKLIDLQNVSTSRVGLSPYTGIVSPAYIILKCKEDVLPSFAEKYFLMMWMNQVFNALGDAGVRSSLNSSELLELSLPLPPIDEQEKISAFLDSKITKINETIKRIEDQVDVLELYKQNYIAEVISNGIDQSIEKVETKIKWIPHAPKHWAFKKAKYCFATRNTKGNKINLELLSPTQKYGVIPQSKYEELTSMVTVKVNENTNLMSFKTIHKGDYCISLRSFEGGFEYSEYEGVVSPAYTVFYPTICVDKRFYKYLFKTQPFIFEMNSYSLSLRDGKPISFDNFGNTYIPIPPLKEQEAIANHLDGKCAYIDSIINGKKEQILSLEEYKKSLIYEYVTGKKEVPNE